VVELAIVRRAGRNPQQPPQTPATLEVQHPDRTSTTGLPSCLHSERHDGLIEVHSFVRYAVPPTRVHGVVALRLVVSR
jgi:hypothetical protein